MASGNCEKETEAAAQSLALQLQILEARSTNELTSAFSAIERARIRAIMTLPDAMFLASESALWSSRVKVAC